MFYGKKFTHYTKSSRWRLVFTYDDCLHDNSIVQLIETAVLETIPLIFGVLVG